MTLNAGNVPNLDIFHINVMQNLRTFGVQNAKLRESIKLQFVRSQTHQTDANPLDQTLEVAAMKDEVETAETGVDSSKM